MQELVAWLAQQLVEDKGAVRVDATERDRTTVLELTVAEDEMGRIIGRGGRTAKALRTIIDVAARQQGRRAILDILD